MQPARIGPYRIDGLLGQGGMGTVYRGYDERLRRPVAIKQIRGAELADPAVRERFWREAQSAAEMRHPAIVQIYHMDADEGRDYIVMELVEGRTLAAVLRRGPLAPRQAAGLFRELAEGLAEAHGRGILHRDLKAENVMVTPAGRVKILDFGLAKRLAPSEAPLSAAGTVVGTLYTMSPEQAQGERVDERSDLFSLGAVLYQALTGQPPFRGETPSETLAKICLHHPQPVASLDPRIPPALSDLVVRLLQKDSDARPPSAAAVADELDRVVATRAAAPAAPVTADEPTVSSPQADSGLLPRRSRRRFGVPLGAAAAVMAAAAGAWLWLREPAGTGPAAAPVAVRPAVAVLGFEQRTTDPGDAWLATALGEMLATELAAGDQVRVVGDDEVTQALHAVAGDRLSELAEDDFSRLGKILGVERLAWGTYGDLGEPAARLLRIELHLHDARSGEILASSGATGTAGGLFVLVDRAAARFREALGAGALTPADTQAAEASLPQDGEALRLYSEGLARLRELDALSARGLFEQAIAAQDDHPLPYAALAQVSSVLGYEDRAREAASKARELAADLSETARLEVEASSHAAAREWDEAARVYGVLFAAFPDDVGLGLRLAQAQIEGGEISASLVTLETLRRLPAPPALDPGIDLTQALAWFRKGDVEQARTCARRAAERGRELGMPLVVARARLRETVLLRYLGEHEQAMAALQEAKTLFETAGDRQGAAEALELIAFAALRQGDLAGARKLFEKAQARYSEVGNRTRAASVLGTLGTIYAEEGRFPEAATLLEQALAEFRALGARHQAAIVLNNLGFNRHVQGDLEAAIATYSEALALFDDLGDSKGAAMASTNIAEILFVRGDLDRARAMHEESLAIHRQNVDRSGIAYDTFRLGKVLAAQGLLHAARGKYEEALAIQQELGETAAAEETRTDLAILELVSGEPAAAEALARQAEEILANEGWSEQTAIARTVVARALLAQGRLAEAREIPLRVEAGQGVRARLALGITAARVRAASPGEAAAAVAELEGVAAEAAAEGHLGEHFEARLAAAETELAAGQAAAAAARLRALVTEARRSGFGQIARRAEKAQGTVPDHRDRSPDSKPSAKIGAVSTGGGGGGGGGELIATSTGSGSPRGTPLAGRPAVTYSFQRTLPRRSTDCTR